MGTNIGTLLEIIICGSTSLPIFDKEEKHYGFAKVRDAQYHMALV